MSTGDCMAPSRLPTAVCDAGPLIHLDELGCIDLLSDFEECIVAPSVRDEVNLHRPQVFRRIDIAFRSSELPNTVPAALGALTRAFELHRGEQQAVAVAVATPGALFLTDDTAARLAASSLSLVVHGSIGLIVRSMRRGQRSRDEVLDLLQSIPKRSSLHIRSSLLARVIETVRAET